MNQPYQLFLSGEGVGELKEEDMLMVYSLN